MALPFFGIGMKTDLFWPCGHRSVFQICGHIECGTLTSSFRIWNSSTGIPSPPLALFVVLLPKTHLTLHSRIALGEWSHDHGFLGHEDLFCVVLCILATSSQCLLLLLGPYHLCPLLCPFLHEVFLWYLIFLKRSLVFPILFFSPISLHWSLRKAFLPVLAILWNSAFKGVYLSFFSFNFRFSSFLSYL